MVSFRRPRRTRPVTWSALEIDSSTDSMSISSTESSPRRTHNTGFPEGFDGQRNTTLPHPDADTSPNACISQEDISVNRVLSRHRRSFLAKHKHKKTTSSGRITAEMQSMYCDTTAVASSSDLPPIGPDSAGLSSIPGAPGIGRPLSNGGDSFDSTMTTDHIDGATAQHSEIQNNFRSRLSSDGGSIKSSRRRNLFGKLGLHKS